MLGVHVGLEPVLINEYSEQFELLIVQVKAGDKDILVMTGYGPQEHWTDGDRLPFFTALEEEIASAEYEGKSVIITMDANSKLGPNYIPGDSHDMSQNGKVLDGIIDRHALCVINGLTGKRKGVITRERHTVNGVERSVIDLVIMSSDMTQHVENIHFDEERVDVLTKNVKLNNGICLTKSDHNIITTKLNISWTTNKAKVIEIFNFKDTKSLEMFKHVTTKTDHLCKIIDSDKSIHLVTKKFLKTLQGFVHHCF